MPLRRFPGAAGLALCVYSAYFHARAAKRQVPRLLDSHSNKRNGAYYTPEGVAGLLVRTAVRSPCDRLLDPACGDGRFLAYHPNSIGVERDGCAALLARQRAPDASVHNDDFFVWARRAHQAGERFDCVVGNPPFIRYQTFSGATRRTALELCEEQGVAFSGLAASWAPFLAVAASLLRAGGRLAFVVPAAIGHAPYAGPLLEYLVGHFRSVRVVAVRRKLFPRLSEDCWLLFAEGFGGPQTRSALPPWKRSRPQTRCRDRPSASTLPSGEALGGAVCGPICWTPANARCTWRLRQRPIRRPRQRRTGVPAARWLVSDIW